MKTLLTTTLALFAFAGNSVLCRLALGSETIDATSFTIVRIVSGALALLFIVFVGRQFNKDNSANDERKLNYKWGKKWLAAGMLFVYAAGFSYAYIVLDTGVGALVLFGTVQITMVAVSIYNNEHLPWFKYLGLLMAFTGLCFLVYSQLGSSSLQISMSGFALMLIAGIAWAIYTLIGRGSITPLVDTGTSFILSALLCVPLLLVYYFTPMMVTERGFWLALASGVLSSALGYTIWYVALSGLSRVQAGVVQLMVPVIAALGGVLWVGESLTKELIIAQALVLSGILMVMIKRRATVI